MTMAGSDERLRGKWAVVTGASSGLGREFAMQLAAKGMHIVAAARREERLEQLGRDIAGRFDTRVLPVPVDLSSEAGAQELHEAVTRERIEPFVLVNNAGFGLHGPFLSIPWDQERAMLDLDIVSLVSLTRRFGEDMVRRGEGHIVQVSSMAGYLAIPAYASYAAAKAFVLHHGIAIGKALRGTGVRVTVLSPGITATEFQQVAGQGLSLSQRIAIMQPDTVVRAGIRAMLRGRTSVVPGALNKLAIGIIRILPRGLAARIAGTVMR
jgi:uncharacterized protein